MRKDDDFNANDLTALIMEARGLRAEATGDMINAGWNALKRVVRNALHKDTNTALAQQKLVAR